jgi:hypothetical protein
MQLSTIALAGSRPSASNNLISVKGPSDGSVSGSGSVRWGHSSAAPDSRQATNTARKACDNRRQAPALWMAGGNAAWPSQRVCDRFLQFPKRCQAPIVTAACRSWAPCNQDRSARGNRQNGQSQNAHRNLPCITNMVRPAITPYACHPIRQR